MNRIDKVVVFHPLGDAELRRILSLELSYVQTRLRQVTGGRGISFKLDGAARGLLLSEGTDARYGARHLKRAIERLLVQPLANLVATAQVSDGDQVFVHADSRTGTVGFTEGVQGRRSADRSRRRHLGGRLSEARIGPDQAHIHFGYGPVTGITSKRSFQLEFRLSSISSHGFTEDLSQ